MSNEVEALEPEVKVISDPAETVYISCKAYSYAIFCYNSIGDLLINSDYGVYGFAWRAYGDNFKAFLSRCNEHYIYDKLESNYNMTLRSAKGINKFCEKPLKGLIKIFLDHLKKTTTP